MAARRSLVTMRRTDRYRGLAFLALRYFGMRRELTRLKEWAETGAITRRFLFERPVTQVGFAVLSAFILWPFFGLNRGGFVLAAVLTAVVALHELGHMAAFRLMGHRRVRMIFIPLLGGIAIGGRPYDSRFEVAFVALMGAGFSAFVVPLAIASSNLADMNGLSAAASVFAVLAGFTAFFNIANLVPVWKFDGGQVLRQICPEPFVLAAVSFATLSAFLLLGRLTGLSPGCPRRHGHDLRRAEPDNRGQRGQAAPRTEAGPRGGARRARRRLRGDLRDSLLRGAVGLCPHHLINRPRPDPLASRVGAAGQPFVRDRDAVQPGIDFLDARPRSRARSGRRPASSAGVPASMS